MPSTSDPLQRRVKKLSATMWGGNVYRLTIDYAVDALKPIGYRLEPSFGKLPSEVRLSQALVQRLVSEPFKRKTFPAQRWNSLEFRCFYSALEPETAVDEVAHYVRKRLLQLPNVSHVYYVQFSVRFQGRVIDIHGLIPHFPELVEDVHHPKCHVVAVAAFRRRIHALLAPSVRRAGGKCLAVYKKRALKGAGEIKGEVRFRRDADGNIHIERPPYA